MSNKIADLIHIINSCPEEARESIMRDVIDKKIKTGEFISGDVEFQIAVMVIHASLLASGVTVECNIDQDAIGKKLQEAMISSWTKALQAVVLGSDKTGEKFTDTCNTALIGVLNEYAELGKAVAAAREARLMALHDKIAKLQERLDALDGKLS